MDSFGFKNQGNNYEKYRPDYPSDFLTEPISNLKGYNRYLDVATGTGKVLFHIFNHFKKAQGIDVSDLMISQAQSEAQKFQKVKIYKCSATQIEINKNQPYDYVTIGEALHFFPIHDSLTRIKEALSPNGKLSVYGYIPMPLSTSKNQNKQKTQNDLLLKEFYDTIRPHYKFCYEDLETYYEDKAKYPFDKIFQKNEKKLIQVPFPYTKQQCIGYLKTLSAYNHFLNEKPEEKDPMIKLTEGLSQKFTLYFQFFRITCQKE